MAEGDGVVNTGGIELHITNSAGELTKLNNLKRCNYPSQTVEEVQTSNQDSGGQHAYQPGMGDTGPLNAVVGYEPGSADDLLIREHLASRERRAFKIVAPKEDGGTVEGAGLIFLTGYVPDDGTLGSERTATLTGKPTTAITQANGS
ncbi:MAG: hypothetical protein AAFP79_04970 [Pseudomonadota bacterium]